MPIVKLTQGFITNDLVCPPDKSQIEFCDSDMPGMYILVSSKSKGHGTIYLRYKDSTGKTCHQKIGRTSDISLADARKQAKMLKSEINLGADPRAEQKKQREVLLFSTFMEEHYLPMALKTKRSYKDDQRMFRLRLNDEFGKKRLNQITRYDIVKFHASLKDQGLAPATCDHHVKLLKHSLNLAIDWGLLNEKNPAARIPLFNADNRVENLLSDDELQRLITVLRIDSNRPVCSIMLFLLSTGARLNEALQATWSQIDIQNRTWTIPAANSKSKRSRAVPLTDSAIDVLNQLDTKLEFSHLFINRKTLRPYTTISKVWNRLQGLAKLSKRMRIHDARHTMAQLMCNAGRTLLEVQSVLGHAHYSTTTRYARLSMSTIQEAANVTSKKIGSSTQAGTVNVIDIHSVITKGAISNSSNKTEQSDVKEAA